MSPYPIEDETMNVEWRCPHCSAMNTDNYYLTTFPVCCNCSQEIEWLEILAPEEFATLNRHVAEFNVELLRQLEREPLNV